MLARGRQLVTQGDQAIKVPATQASSMAPAQSISRAGSCKPSAVFTLAALSAASEEG